MRVADLQPASRHEVIGVWCDGVLASVAMCADPDDGAIGINVPLGYACIDRASCLQRNEPQGSAGREPAAAA